MTVDQNNIGSPKHHLFLTYSLLNKLQHVIRELKDQIVTQIQQESQWWQILKSLTFGLLPFSPFDS